MFACGPTNGYELILGQVLFAGLLLLSPIITIGFAVLVLDRQDRKNDTNRQLAKEYWGEKPQDELQTGSDFRRDG